MSASAAAAPAAATSSFIGKKVPHSCIESAETILRTINNASYKFTKGGQGSSAGAPPMYLHLKNGHSAMHINVSDTDSDKTFLLAEGKSSYLPEAYELKNLILGQGVCFMRTAGKGTGYDMHFLALLWVKVDGTAVFSDVSEPDKWNEKSQVILKIERTAEAKKVSDLRASLGGDYTKVSEFSCGVISLSATPP